MADENLKAQKIYGKYIKELPQVTEVNDTDDIIIEDSTPITSRAKLGVLFDSIKKRIASTWRFTELNNKTIVEYASELNKNIIKNTDEQQIYTLYGGLVKVVSGTMIVNIAMNIGYAKLFSVEQLKNWFGDDYAASRLGIKKHFVTQWWHMDIKPESMRLHLGTRTISARHGDILCGLHLTALNLPE